jgi:hypothetical protein
MPRTSKGYYVHCKLLLYKNNAELYHIIYEHNIIYNIVFSKDTRYIIDINNLENDFQKIEFYTMDFSFNDKTNKIKEVNFINLVLKFIEKNENCEELYIDIEYNKNYQINNLILPKNLFKLKLKNWYSNIVFSSNKLQILDVDENIISKLFQEKIRENMILQEELNQLKEENKQIKKEIHNMMEILNQFNKFKNVLKYPELLKMFE